MFVLIILQDKMPFFDSAKNSRELIRWMFSSSSSCKVDMIVYIHCSLIASRDRSWKLAHFRFSRSPVGTPLNKHLPPSSVKDNTRQWINLLSYKATICFFSLVEKFGQIVHLVKMILILKENLCVFTRYFEWIYQVCWNGHITLYCRYHVYCM